MQKREKSGGVEVAGVTTRGQAEGEGERGVESKRRRGGKAAGQLRKDDDRGPAEGDADRGREPLRRADPCELEDRSGGRARPHYDGNGPAPRPGEDEEADGCIRARDQEVDAGVIGPPHPQPQARRPRDPVVERAYAETDRDRTREHRSGDVPARAVGADDQQRADDKRDGERNLVEHAAKQRAYEHLLSAGSHRLPGSPSHHRKLSQVRVSRDSTSSSVRSFRSSTRRRAASKSA